MASLPAGVLRATALFHLMYVARLSGSLERAVEHGVQAAAEAADDPLFQAEVLEILSRISDNDIERKLDAARRALAAVERVSHPDPEVVFQVRAALVEAEFYAGLGVHLERLEGLDPTPRRRFPPVRTASRGDDLVGRLLAYDGRIDEGLDLLRGMYDRASVENRSILPAVLGWMAEAELMAGRFAAARELTREAVERAEETVGKGGLPWEVGFHAVSLARLGLVDEAESTAAQVLDADAAQPPVGLDGAPARLALGVAALSRGDVEQAVAHLRALDELKRGSGIREPRLCAHAGDLLEALVAAGELEEATEVLARLEDEATTSDGRRTEAVAARGRAMVLAGRGDVDGAAAAERSLELLEGCRCRSSAPGRSSWSVSCAVAGGRSGWRARLLDAVLVPSRTSARRDWADRADRARAGPRWRLRRQPDPDRGAGRPARRRGSDQPRDRRAHVPQPEDRRGQPDPGLPQARRTSDRRWRTGWPRPTERVARRGNPDSWSPASPYVHRVTRTSGTHWVAECFWPGVHEDELLDLDRRVVSTTSELVGRGDPVRYLGSLRITDDEVVLFLFEGAMSSVQQVAERAGIRAERILHCTRTTVS